MFFSVYSAPIQLPTQATMIAGSSDRLEEEEEEVKACWEGRHQVFKTDSWGHPKNPFQPFSN